MKRILIFISFGFFILIAGLFTITINKAIAGDIQVHTYTTSEQQSPSVAMDSNGNFVIVWESYGQDGDGSGIFAQMYDSLGNPIGSEFQVNTYTTYNQADPSVAMDSNGNFVISWGSNGPPAGDYGIFAQMYDSLGNPVGSEFQVNTYTTSEQHSPSVAMDSNGNFVITWKSYGQDGDGYGIYAQRYDSSGNPIGSEFQVNTYTTSGQHSPSVAMDSNGNFVITWKSYGQDGMVDGSGIFAQMYDSLGNSIGSEFQVNNWPYSYQHSPSVAMDPNGNFVISWGVYGTVGGGWGIRAQMYDSLGNSIGGSFQVNDWPYTDQYSPSVAMDSNGNFVISWGTHGLDSYGSGIFAQMYDSLGNSIGSEFQVNTYTLDVRRDPSVAMDPNGNFVIVWESYGQDGDGYGVFMMRFFDQDGDGLKGPFDNCPNDFNDDQADADNDLIGDVCDPFPIEADHEKAQLEADLAQAQADLAQTQADLVQALNDLALSQSELTQCVNDYAQCQADLFQSEANYAQSTSDLIQCESDLDQCLNPPIIEPEGPGQTCQDRLDNDNDELLDCADPDCSKKKYCK